MRILGVRNTGGRWMSSPISRVKTWFVTTVLISIVFWFFWQQPVGFLVTVALPLVVALYVHVGSIIRRKVTYWRRMRPVRQSDTSNTKNVLLVWVLILGPFVWTGTEAEYRIGPSIFLSQWTWFFGALCLFVPIVCFFVARWATRRGRLAEIHHRLSEGGLDAALSLAGSGDHVTRWRLFTHLITPLCRAGRANEAVALLESEDFKVSEASRRMAAIHLPNALLANGDEDRADDATGVLVREPKFETDPLAHHAVVVYWTRRGNEVERLAAEDRVLKLIQDGKIPAAPGATDEDYRDALGIHDVDLQPPGSVRPEPWSVLSDWERISLATLDVLET